MTGLFFTVMEMSGYGLVAALVVMAAFLLLRRTRASKTALLALWLIVGFRLVCPWSLPSPLSIFNWDPASRGAQRLTQLEDAYVGNAQAAVELPGGGNEYFERAVAAGAEPKLEDAVHARVAYYYRDAETGDITPAKTFREAYGGAAAALWLAGAAGLLAYSGVSYLLLRRKLRFAVKDRDRPGVWYSDRVPSPCVTGLVRPQIYLTFGMSGEEREYVLAHERQHVKNGDHLWKVLGWLILCVHWFNPLLWVCWAMFLSNLEEACDQRVLRELGEERKADYGQVLLSLSRGKRFRPGFSPLAFGEGDTKERVKTVLKYKKPLAWLTAIVLVLGATVGVCVLTSRADREAAAEDLERFYGTYQIDGVVWQTPFSSSTSDFLLEKRQGEEIVFTAERFAGDGVEVEDPVYEPMNLGDTLATTEMGDEDFQDMFALDLTEYRSVRGWKVARPDGMQTGKHVFLVDGRLWLGDWVYHDTADTPYSEYWEIFSASRPEDAGTAQGALSGDTAYWEFRPALSSGAPGFPIQLLFFAECEKIELSCENDSLTLYSFDYNGPTIRERGQALTIEGSFETVYWSPFSERKGTISKKDEISVKAYQDGEAVFTATILMELQNQAEDSYEYAARASLSDFEHYNFSQNTDEEVGGALLLGGPDHYPDFTFTAKVEAVDPDAENDQVILTVRPEQDLADGVSTYRFSWTNGAFHTGDRVLVTARDADAATDAATGETMGYFGQVDCVASLANIAAEWRVDLTHDGTDERVYVADCEDGGYCLVVESAAEDSGPRLLWYGMASTSHAGQNGYYLYRDSGRNDYYLLSWAPYMDMGIADYQYRLFSLSPQGYERTVRKGSASFDISDLWSADVGELLEFDAAINGLLEDSVVLLSTNYDTPEGVYCGDPKEPVAPALHADGWVEKFERDQALAQDVYHFNGEVVARGEDYIQVASETLWEDSYMFLIPASDLVDGPDSCQQGDQVTVTADGPLYRSRFPDADTEVTARRVCAEPVPETPPAE